MEKLCVTEDLLMQQFGQEAVTDGCASLDTGRVQYCACATNKCNEPTIGDQMDAVDGSLAAIDEDDAVEPSRPTAGAIVRSYFHELNNYRSLRMHMLIQTMSTRFLNIFTYSASKGCKEYFNMLAVQCTVLINLVF